MGKNSGWSWSACVLVLKCSGGNPESQADGADMDRFLDNTKKLWGWKLKVRVGRYGHSSPEESVGWAGGG